MFQGVKKIMLNSLIRPNVGWVIYLFSYKPLTLVAERHFYELKLKKVDKSNEFLILNAVSN